MRGNEGDGELMRDRLIELLRQRSCYYVDCSGRSCVGCQNVFIQDNDIERIADHLLENGVIVPPCKVGDIIYALNYDGNGYMPLSVTSRESLVRWMEEDQFGNTLFINREEAEQALKGEHHAEIH